MVKNNKKPEDIKKKLKTYYKEKVVCGSGAEDENSIEYTIPEEKINIADFAIYLHEKLQIAAIWFLKNRRFHNHNTRYLTVSKSWESLLGSDENIKAYYHYLNKHCYYEKVLFVSFNFLEENLETIEYYLLLNPEDNEFPNSFKVDIKNEKYICPETQRKRCSTSKVVRDYRFRLNVLQAYDYQCAICRCNEIRILQAAHIVAVADKGNDDIENGICLCANHHLMLDNELIKIDYKTNKLCYVSESVRLMAWYDEFINRYGGTIKKKYFC